MLFRAAFRPTSLAARCRLSPSTPRFFPASVVPRLQPTRFTSSDSPSSSPTPTALPSTLTPPWTISDLSRKEKAAYDTHGPDYLSHLDRRERSLALRKANKRAKCAAKMEAKYGEDWYGLLARAKKRFYETHVTTEPWDGKGPEFARKQKLETKEVLDQYIEEELEGKKAAQS